MKVAEDEKIASVPPLAPVEAQGALRRSAAPSEAGLLRRAVEWLWRGHEIAGVRAGAQRAEPRARELHRRARLAFELGDRALEPRGPLADGSGDALACDLYRQSLYWALRSVAPGLSAPAPQLQLGAAEAALLLRATGDADDVALVKTMLAEQSFVDFAELPSEAQARLARRLQRICGELLSAIDHTQRAVDRLVVQRVVRISALIAVAVAAIVIRGLVLDRLEQQADLARGKPWKASSTFQPACKSPAQSCVESPHFFFVTKEDASPQLEFDLGAPRSFSAVRIVNRTDGYQDRAVPLVIEASLDGKKWTEIARRRDTFTEWKAEFKKVTARHVRFRALRRTWLHFNRVRILP